MKCKVCGRECKEGMKFCSGCGTPIEPQAAETKPEPTAEVQEDKQVVLVKETASEAAPEATVTGQSETQNVDAAPSEKKPIDKRILAAAGVAAVLLLGVFVAISGKKPAGSGEKSYNNIIKYYSPKEDETYLMVDGKVLEESIMGEASELLRTMDNTGGIFADEDNTLYFLGEDQVTRIADDVAAYSMSVNGDFVVYVDEENELYLYDVKKKDKELIAEELVEERNLSWKDDTYDRALILSPDGKTVAYNTIDDSDDVRLQIYYKGKTEAAGKQLSPLSITNDGICMAVHEEDDTLYKVTPDGEKERVAKNVDCYLYTLNNQHTEIVYYTDKENTYFYQIGQEPIKLSGKKVYDFLTEENQNEIYRQGRYCGLYTSNVDSLVGSVFRDDSDKFFVFTKDLEVERLVTGKEIINYRKVKDKIYYLDRDKIYSVGTVPGSKAEKLAEDVKQMVVTRDGKTIYYVDTDDTLWAKTDQETEIMEDVYSMMLDKNNTLYFIAGDIDKEGDLKKNSGTLYQYISGKEPKVIAEGIDRAGMVNGDKIMYYEFGKEGPNMPLRDVYVETNKKGSFDAVLENVEVSY